MIQYNFVPQIVKGKPKIKGVGVLTIANKEAIFFEGEANEMSAVLGVLKNPELVSMTSRGIMIKGFEPVGADKQGREKYNYQEWYCSFV